MNDQRAILIAGPTASGKSGLALCLAERLGGAVINADSMQVYRELRILTARPSAADEARAPHKLYGTVSGADAYSVGRFVEDAAAAISETRKAGLRPILVGGTGLYFKALLEGLSPVPKVSAEIRNHYRRLATTVLGAQQLYQELSDRDPDMASRLEPGDRQRIVRALEVLEGTGKSLAHWQSLPGQPVLTPDSTIRLRLDIDRLILEERANARLDEMLNAGALEEVRELLRLNLPGNLPLMRALGVPELSDAIRGTTTLEAALAAAKRATRLYIKRQVTWINRHMISWKDIKMELLERTIADNEMIID